MCFVTSWCSLLRNPLPGETRPRDKALPSSRLIHLRWKRGSFSCLSGRFCHRADQRTKIITTHILTSIHVSKTLAKQMWNFLSRMVSLLIMNVSSFKARFFFFFFFLLFLRENKDVNYFSFELQDVIFVFHASLNPGNLSKKHETGETI